MMQQPTTLLNYIDDTHLLRLLAPYTQGSVEVILFDSSGERLRLPGNEDSRNATSFTRHDLASANSQNDAVQSMCQLESAVIQPIRIDEHAIAHVAVSERHTRRHTQSTSSEATREMRLDAKQIAVTVAETLATVCVMNASHWARLANNRDQLESANRALETRNAALAATVNRLKELDLLKSQFLATMSHELKTPLTSIIGYSEMLAEGFAGALNTEQLEYVSIVQERGQSLLTMIDNLLKIATIQRGGASLDLAPVDLVSIIEDVVRTLQPSAMKAQVSLVCDTQPHLPDVQADAQKVSQVLLNLVGNAIKFTPPGGQVLISLAQTRLPRTSSAKDDGARDGVRIRIKDSGVGIDPANHQRIFDAFYQVDNTATREYGGAGLGLSIAKSFVEAHGGRLDVMSGLGQGATFSFALPLSQGTNAWHFESID